MKGKIALPPSSELALSKFLLKCFVQLLAFEKGRKVCMTNCNNAVV